MFHRQPVTVISYEPLQIPAGVQDGATLTFGESSATLEGCHTAFKHVIKSIFDDSLLCRVCFSELVKLFCAEQSHRKELLLFLRGLITSLDVSDERRLRTSISDLQTKFTQPHILAVYFTLPSRRWPLLITNGPFFPGGTGSRVHHTATRSRLRRASARIGPQRGRALIL